MDDKKFIKAKMITWGAVALILTGLLALIIVFKSTHFLGEEKRGSISRIFNFKANSFQGASKKVVLDKSFKTQEIRSITTDLASEDINILEAEGEEIRVVERSNRELSEDEMFRISQRGDTLKISKGRDKIRFFVFNLSIDNRVLDLYIPKNYKGDISLKTASGNIDLQTELDLGEYAFETHQASGNLDAGNIKAREIAMSTQSGNIDIKNLMTSKYSVDVTSGDISIDDLKGAGKINTTSGSIKSKINSITGDIQLNTTSGDICLDISPECAFELYAHCISGEVDVNFPIEYSNKRENEAIAKVGTNPKYKLDIKAISGDIELNR